jgi:hypothetical protein
VSLHIFYGIYLKETPLFFKMHEYACQNLPRFGKNTLLPLADSAHILPEKLLELTENGQMFCKLRFPTRIDDSIAQLHV